MSEDIKLHIGGTERHEGWSVLDVNPGEHVDYVGNCIDLSMLADESCSEIYASHVLEHLAYNGELEQCLMELYRVMKPKGRLRVSVPDLEMLCHLFVHPKLDFKARYHVMRMMFGGRQDAYDVHPSGLWFEFLGMMIQKVGFVDINRVDTFDQFKDASSMMYLGNRVSLNIIAFKG